MPITAGTGLSAAAVFAEGLLSFFSPCVLPLVPVYVSYLAGGAAEDLQVGVSPSAAAPRRRRLFVNTVFFVLGVSAAFFLMGFAFTAVGQFFSAGRQVIARISGALMIIFGLVLLGAFRKSGLFERERRLPWRLQKAAMGPLPALALGFTFSFAWTPCVGPVLGGVLLLAGAQQTASQAALLIGVYTLGFVLPFLAVALFTGAVLGFFRAHAGVLRWTGIVSGVLLILLGIFTLTGSSPAGLLKLTEPSSGSSSVSAPVSSSAASSSPGAASSSKAASSPKAASSSQAQASSAASSSAAPASSSRQEPASSEPAAASSQPGSPSSQETASSQAASSSGGAQTAADPNCDLVKVYDFTLTDQTGRTARLSDYYGKVVFLNYWATWCPYCVNEMPAIQKLYENYGSNGGDVIVLGISSDSLSTITSYMSSKGYTYPSFCDSEYTVWNQYGLTGIPLTYVFDRSGNLYQKLVGGPRSLASLTAEVEGALAKQ